MTRIFLQSLVIIHLLPLKGYLKRFTFNPDNNAYICPQKHELAYTTTDRTDFRMYKSNADHCKTCPVLRECTRSKSCQKVITRNVGKTEKNGFVKTDLVARKISI